MPVPTYDQFIEPVLRFLALQNNPVAARVVADQAASLMQLTEPQRQELLPSGTQQTYKNRVAWAYDRLRRANLASSPRRGFWQITSNGQKFLEQYPQPFSTELIKQIAQVSKNLTQKMDDEPAETETHLSDSELTQSPEDRLNSALHEIKQSTQADLIELLLNVSPTYFETIVLDVLHKMGYGTDRSDLQRVGQTGDEGIDGIISLDKLGLEKIYVQAKRWQSNVGRPELQAFYGALAGQKAKKGIFITTSDYSKQARDYANSIEGLVIVSGSRFAELMIEYEVGVSAKTIFIPKIDSDYFEEVST